MATCLVSLSLLGASSLEQLLDGGGKVEWGTSSTSMMPGLSGVAQWSLGDEGAWMDSCKAEAPLASWWRRSLVR
jgi:hypothetical protein